MTGEASQARHELVSPARDLRFANRGRETWRLDQGRGVTACYCLLMGVTVSVFPKAGDRRRKMEVRFTPVWSVLLSCQRANGPSAKREDITSSYLYMEARIENPCQYLDWAGKSFLALSTFIHLYPALSSLIDQGAAKAESRWNQGGSGAESRWPGNGRLSLNGG